MSSTAETDTSNQVRQEADTGETAADNASGTDDNANNDKKGSKRDAFLYGVLMEAASFLPIATPVKQWIQEHVDFYVTCAIVKESIDKRDEQKTAYLYTDLKTVDYEKGYTAFDAVNDVISRQTGTGLEEADYRKISYVNDINRSNEEVLYETVAGGNRANGSFAYRYGIQRESYSYEAAATTAGSRAFDSLSISQSGSYYYDGYGSVSNLSAGEDSISYTYDAYGNMQKTGTYGEISTDSSAYGSPYGYNGEYSHALTGLQYLRARYYQASTGSFISKDSYAGNIRNILSANRYTYGENNPLGYADPSGHSVLSKIKSAVSSAVNTVKNTVSKAVTSVRNAVSSAVSALHHTSNAVSTAVSNTGRTIANGVAQKKAQLSAIKADIVSNVSSTYDRASAAAGRMYGKIAAGVSQAKAAINEGIYTAANKIHEMERKACKAYEACKNAVQEKVKSMDKGRIINGTLLIVGGAGKIMGAVGLAVISFPFCAGGIGIGGEIAAGIVAAAGVSDIAEGIQEIMYGWNGDSESESFNLVRDTLYAGNERAYEISTGIAATCGDIGLSLVKNAINKAAEEAFESKLKKELTEQAAKTAAKEAEDVAEKTVQNSAKEALKDTVKNNVDDAIEEATEAVQKNLDDVVKDASGVEKISETSYGKSSGKYDTTADFLTNIENRNGKFYTDKATIDKIGQVEARGEDFSLLNKRIMSSRASTEGGTSVVYKYSDELGTKYLIHEVTDARGYIIHRDFDAVRISSGQLINKGH